MADSKDAVTQALKAAQAGDKKAEDELWELTYDELHRLAQRMMRNERQGHTLAPADLISEIYLRLVDQDRIEWRDRAHFYRVAARACRRFLIDYARRHGAQKRGGGRARVTIDRVQIESGGEALEVLALDEALERLEALDPRLYQVVELRHFGGLSEEETAQMLDVSTRTVRRDWVKAKGLLLHYLKETDTQELPPRG